MVELSPRLIGLVLVVILTITTTQFFFAPPMSNELQGSSKGVKETEEIQANFYGAPNAEFDWCEPNFQYSDLVAEPVNTLTGFLYFLPLAAGLRYHQRQDISRMMIANLFIVAWIGLGTVLFHATLRYTAQLLDELPIYYVTLSGTYLLLARGTNGRPGLGWAFTGWAIALTSVILSTEQEEQAHILARGVLSVTFSMMFLHLFAGVASGLKATEEAARVGSSPHVGLEAVAGCKALFNQTFLFFVVGLLCWIVDNGFCEHLGGQSSSWVALPFYIQTHALWHVFTSLGLYQMAVVLEFLTVAAAGERPIRVVRKGVFKVAALNFDAPRNRKEE